ncbi:MAG: hypothetical protein Q4P65_04205 [Eubacteriales bacterium]|nr:hypothetical protein [Eubacteriales bacterium]
MKSKILSVPDYTKIPLDEKYLNLNFDEKQIEKDIEAELLRIAKKYGEVVEAPPGHQIAEGDIVMVRASSELPKFNKSMIPLTVGRGLFDFDFEEAILGLVEGETKEVELQGHKVKLSILKVKTKTVPDLSLEMVKAENNDYFEPASSIEDYKAKYRQAIIDTLKAEQYFNGAAAELRDGIIAAAEYAIDEAELSDFVESQMQAIREEAMRSGQTAGEYMRGLFSNPAEASDEEIAERVKENLIRDFKLDLYARSYLKDEVDCSLEAYEAEVKMYSAETGESAESLRAQLPFEAYKRQVYSAEIQARLMEEFNRRVTEYEG